MAIDIVPKFVTFDLYGTLIHFQYDRNVRRILGDRLPDDKVDEFEAAHDVIRFDEALGDWRPYDELLARALRRATAKVGIEYRAEDARQAFEAVRTFGPYPDVPPALRALAGRYPLVMLTNAADSEVGHNVERLDAPVHAVFTAEQARAYKPRLRAFEYMLERLGVAPGEIVHVSSSPMYDHRPANDLGIVNKVYLDRGWEPHQPWLRYERITSIGELPALLGVTDPVAAV